MQFNPLIASALGALAINAHALSFSTFHNNGGVHQDAEYAAALIGKKPVVDTFTFTLATAGDLFADSVVIGKTTGEVDLFKEAGAVDTLLGSFSLAFGSASFSTLAAGDYYYQVSATGKGGYLLESLLTPVPEPATRALLLAGLGVVGFMLRRQSRA